MMRLDKLYIKGFKDPDREINLTFAEGPITVIFGKNGCGKTTLLKILSAVLSRDEKTLIQENVIQVDLVYEKDGISKNLIINRNSESNIIDWTDDFDIYSTSSILFGVHRGVVSEDFYPIIKIFNDHLYNNKKLVVDSEKSYIQLKNDKTHALSELSSGERNLLSILSLFLIIGNKRNFLMIDEPENSLHLEWQEEFLQLINKMNPNAQIIVATHSPAIAADTNSLVELI